MKRQVVTSLEDLERLEQRILSAVEATTATLKRVLESSDSLGGFARLKFTEAGHDPLDPERPLNFIEQLNQTFTYLASIGGARWLIERYPHCTPLVLNLGTAPGFDIESSCGQFAAETFAVTHPSSNDKLRKDASKMREAQAEHRFVFYLSLARGPQVHVPGVTVVPLDHRVMAMLDSEA